MSGGFPHSEIPGSKGALASPGLIAECHVLHRLLPPRHPPNALLALDPSRKTTGEACSRPLRDQLGSFFPMDRRTGLNPHPASTVSILDLERSIPITLRLCGPGDQLGIDLVSLHDVNETAQFSRNRKRSKRIGTDEAAPPVWWSLPGSNRRPSACKADALPAELRPHVAAAPGDGVVGRGGLEPPTSRLSGVRSNHLSYRPIRQKPARPARRAAPNVARPAALHPCGRDVGTVRPSGRDQGLPRSLLPGGSSRRA